MDANVYLGIWTNWSRGPIFGPTLTLTRAHGNYLIAFTASFVPFAASRFWRILCLFIHRSYSTAQQRHTIHHQRQVILRTSSTPDSALESLLSLLWTWRSLTIKHLVPLGLLALLASSFLFAFTVAGGVSSIISSAVGDEVLLDGGRCGVVIPRSESMEDEAFISRYTSELLDDARNYAQQCYRSNKFGSMECNKFVVRNVTAVSNNTASCPFDDSICRNTNSNIELDTGYIDSNEILGLNAPENERFAFRYILNCAPLTTEGRTSHVIVSNQSMVKYYYGTDNERNQNFTHATPYLETQYNAIRSARMPNFEIYWVDVPMHQGKPIFPSFTPIPELMPADGDLTIIFLSGNGVIFGNSADDTWYRATKVARKGMGFERLTRNMTVYEPGEAASPMGCVTRTQWCNSAYPRDRGCEPLTGMMDSMYGAAPLFNLTPGELNSDRPLSADPSGSRLIWPVLTLFNNPISITTLLRHLGTKSLQSQSGVNNGIQWSLADNQWQLDVSNWFNTILAMIQASFVNTAIGPRSLESEQFSYLPLNENEQYFCDSQKIRSSAHTSFSLFGLYFTSALGVIIVVLSYSVEPILSWLYKRRRYKPYAHLEWQSNASLQLHRLAHEELGLAQWSNCLNEVPTTDADVFLASLDTTNPEHPILSRPQEIDTAEKPGPEAQISEQQEDEGDSHSSTTTDDTASMLHLHPIGDEVAEEPNTLLEIETDSTSQSHRPVLSGGTPVGGQDRI